MKRSLQLARHALEKHADEVGGQHYYLPPLQSWVPSVTTILKGPAPLVSDWSCHVAQARLRGRELHDNVEAFLLDPEAPVRSGFFSSLEPFLERIDDVWLVEGPLWHGDGFAGTVDCIAVVDGELSVIDWKSSSDPRSQRSVEDHHLQIAAYRVAAQSLYGITIKRGFVVVALPYQVAQVFPAKNLDEGYQKFLGRLRAFRAKARPFQPPPEAASARSGAGSC